MDKSHLFERLVKSSTEAKVVRSNVAQDTTTTYAASTKKTSRTTQTDDHKIRDQRTVTKLNAVTLKLRPIMWHPYAQILELLFII